MRCRCSSRSATGRSTSTQSSGPLPARPVSCSWRLRTIRPDLRSTLPRRDACRRRFRTTSCSSSTRRTSTISIRPIGSTQSRICSARVARPWCCGRSRSSTGSRGYGSATPLGTAVVIDAMRRVQRGYDVGALSQAAALASLGQPAEVERRRAANASGVAALSALLDRHGLEPLEGSRGNFVLARVGERADEVAAALERVGVIVQNGAPFGAAGTLRITAGTADDLEVLDASADERVQLRLGIPGRSGSSGTLTSTAMLRVAAMLRPFAL